MANEQEKRQLVFRRTALLASLGRAKKFLEEYEDERDRLEVALRIDNLDMVRQDLEEIQAALECNEETSAGMTLNNQIRSGFESQFFKIKAGLLSKLPSPTSGSTPNPLPPTVSSSLKGLKLPTITLPEFNGDFKEWLAFHDTFLALIHSNQDVPDIQKFHYLKSSVTGEAAQVIESFAISANNYSLAWQALVARYANEYLLKKRHLQAMLEIQRVKKETTASLHGIVDDFERHTKILRQLGEPVNAWSTILEHLLCVRLPDETLKAWEDHAASTENPTYDGLIEFLHRRIRVLESISVNHVQLPQQFVTSSHVSTASNFYQVKTTSSAASDSPSQCFACEQRHPLVQCAQFQKMSAADRLAVINANRLCLNCFRSDHFSRNCPSKFLCRFCRRRHHSLLHSGFGDNSSTSGFSNGARMSTNVNTVYASDESASPVFSAATSIQPAKVSCSLPLQGAEKSIFMLTAIVVVVDRYGKEHLARALLDSASQPNLMTEKMAQLLRLQRSKTNVLVQGIGEQPQNARQSVYAEIRSRKQNFSVNAEFLILPQVTPDLPAHDVPMDHWKLPSHIFLADPQFHKRAPIDMILGIEHFFSFFQTVNRINFAKCHLMLVDSVFGWLVSGSIDRISTVGQNPPCSIVAVSLFNLEERVERFWKVEELQPRSDYSLEEKQCEELFSSTTSRNPEGRYVVHLPRRSDFDELVGESMPAALHRFHLLERRLERNTELKAEYHQFMAEYLSLGHMRRVPMDDGHYSGAYYLPHHPVVKEASTTTKVRVVFDASAKTSTGFSLNEALLVGPVVQDDLLSIILRFRTFLVALVGDIAKMYRQILVNAADVPFQRILWRFDSADPIEIFELLTITYGLSPSSFLATRTLQQLSVDEGGAYPLGRPALRENFYVDDFIGGAQSVEEAIQLRTELSELLAKGGFTLRKWASNQLPVLAGLSPDEIGTQSSIKFDENETVNALGIAWEPETDNLRIDANVFQRSRPPTKRSVLSGISQLFDPLGLIAPIVVRGKMLMQRIWLLPCGWDDEVPEPVAAVWEDFMVQILKISDFRVSRYALLPNSLIQVHTFSDASESAYGACTYVRCTDPSGRIRVELLASKSRVAPLKKITLPRLELCAADVAAKLHTRIIEALQVSIDGSYFWSDSTVTLQWLRAPPSTWKTFVANRVSEIQSSTHGASWNHVTGKDNPADLVSRGMHVDDFLVSELWKRGPEWLSKPEETWPVSKLPEYPENGKERRKLIVAVARTQAVSTVNPIFARFSSYERLLRAIAYVLRFNANLRNKARTQPIPSAGPLPSISLTNEHLRIAERTLVQLAQADAFHEELRDLQNDKVVGRRSSTRLLNPFLDSEGTMRVGGRLSLSDQPFLIKHPALLPNNHPLSRLIAKSYHLSLIHGGGRLTLAAMREKYWPIHGRRLVRSTLRSCYRCARANPVPTSQQIGQLPPHRITPARPFAITGMDFAGPVFLKPTHKRAAATKAYFCIFICFCTKAVHIELVSDLSTPAFLSALRRFIARRGRPSDLYSDNGKNFQGAANELEDVYRMLQDEDQRHRIVTDRSSEQINWHFNPPKAPHFGGLWEAAVKVAKRQLYRQLGNSKLSFEDFTTVLAQIEASMNSRPLVPLSEDPNDITALTPAHFLIGGTMQSLPEPDMLRTPMNRLVDRYHQLQRIYQQFWHHWRTEYLQEQQRNTKTCSSNTDLQPGRLVVLVDEMKIPVKWPLARIIAVYPGKDKLVRVVSLRTDRGIIVRPITRICLLPLEEMENDCESTEELNQRAES